MTQQQKLPLGYRLAYACPECGSSMHLRDSKHGLFYGCAAYPTCRATHGAHPDGRPLGTPANAETKRARIAAHEAFDKLWKEPERYMTRRDAYRWLADLLGLSPGEAHIATFDRGQCNAVIDGATKVVEQLQQAREGSLVL